jgi:hypothetical protein
LHEDTLAHATLVDIDTSRLLAWQQAIRLISQCSHIVSIEWRTAYGLSPQLWTVSPIWWTS